MLLYPSLPWKLPFHFTPFKKKNPANITQKASKKKSTKRCPRKIWLQFKTRKICVTVNPTQLASGSVPVPPHRLQVYVPVTLPAPAPITSPPTLTDEQWMPYIYVFPCNVVRCLLNVAWFISWGLVSRIFWYYYYRWRWCNFSFCEFLFRLHDGINALGCCNSLFLFVEKPSWNKNLFNYMKTISNFIFDHY